MLLPTKALIKEWLLEIAEHTKGFHVIEQREDGTLFSLTYGKSHPPIDGNALVISTLDRVCRHPFTKLSAWDYVVCDECLALQNADAKRVPSAWRQVEISTCGVLMLSATFFRSKYDRYVSFPYNRQLLCCTLNCFPFSKFFLFLQLVLYDSNASITITKNYDMAPSPDT